MTKVTDAYRRHRSAKRLNRAFISAIGTSRSNLLELTENEDINLNLQNVNKLLTSLGPYTNYDTSSHTYPDLNNNQSIDAKLKEEVLNKYTLEKSKPSGDLKLDLLKSSEIFFFNDDDYTVPLNDIKDDFINNNNITSNLQNSTLHLNYVKFKASQVYCKSNKFQIFETSKLLKNSNNLNIIHLFDIHYNLSKYPKCKLHNDRLKFLPYYDSNVLVNLNYNSNSSDERKTSVKFEEFTRKKPFFRQQPPILVSPKKRRIPQEFKPNPKPPTKSCLKKDLVNKNYHAEIKLASYCDVIDINQFIKLLDAQFKNKVKKHRIRSKRDKLKIV